MKVIAVFLEAKVSFPLSLAAVTFSVSPADASALLMSSTRSDRDVLASVSVFRMVMAVGVPELSLTVKWASLVNLPVEGAAAEPMTVA